MRGKGDIRVSMTQHDRQEGQALHAREQRGAQGKVSGCLRRACHIRMQSAGSDDWGRQNKMADGGWEGGMIATKMADERGGHDRVSSVRKMAHVTAWRNKNGVCDSMTQQKWRMSEYEVTKMAGRTEGHGSVMQQGGGSGHAHGWMVQWSDSVEAHT